MNFLNKMERKFGRFVIPNLMYYIMMVYVAGLVICMINPMFYFRYLSLAPSMIVHKFQIWRLVSFLVWPPVSSGNIVSLILFNFFMISLYYSVGSTLERIWGTFRFNVYFLFGVLGNILAAFFLYAITGRDYLLSTQYLNASLFLAFAVTFPDMHFYLYGILPVKAKWLGLFDGAIFLLNFLIGGAAKKVEIVVSLLNFLVFLVLSKNYTGMSPKQMHRKKEFKAAKIKAASVRTNHRCAVCGRTEKDGEDLEFRYCSKCEGSYEYCQDHLYTHKHVTKETIEKTE